MEMCNFLCFKRMLAVAKLVLGTKVGKVGQLPSNVTSLNYSSALFGDFEWIEVAYLKPQQQLT